ncbi:DUF4258 domain-containing protein [bacterium]|nr:MAG: DUF4258 domain-containing protein [bacterium]
MTSARRAAVLTRLTLDGPSAPLEATPNHPLFVEGRGWTQAGAVRVGELLRTHIGLTRVAAASAVARDAWVFNLEVQRAHQYRVGDAGVWAHNACAGISASTPVGSVERGPMTVQPGTNTPATIGGRDYTGHAIDRMQQRGLVPSVVEDAIANGLSKPGRVPGTTDSYSFANDVTAVTDTASGRVVTTFPGKGKGF